MSVTLPGTGAVVSTDAITTLNGGAAAAGELIQRVKLSTGAAGTATDIAAANPLPVSQQTAIPTGANTIGAVTGPAAAALALDGTDITTPTAMPAGGVGIRGWLSAIWTKLNGSVAVAATLGAETTKVIGTVNLSAAQTLAAVTAITNALPAGANTIGAVNIAAAQTLATVTTVGAVTAITNALPAGTNNIGQVVNVRPTAGTVTSVVAASASTTLLASNVLRKAGAVFNDGGTTLYLHMGGGTASATVFTTKVLPGGFYEFPFPATTGLITGFWDATASGSARVTEYT